MGKDPFSCTDLVKVLVLDPLCRFARVPSFSPTPEVLPDAVVYIVEDFLADSTSIIISESSENGVQMENDLFLFCAI
jgi:hypothetical protein